MIRRVQKHGTPQTVHSPQGFAQAFRYRIVSATAASSKDASQYRNRRNSN